MTNLIKQRKKLCAYPPTLAVAVILPIVTLVSISDDRCGNEPDAGGLVCGTWDSGENATCDELWYAVELA